MWADVPLLIGLFGGLLSFVTVPMPVLSEQN